MRVRTAVVAAGLVMACGQARAQEDALRGPKVRTDAPPGVVERFGEGEPMGKGGMRDRLPMRSFIAALGVLRESEDPALRPTPEQEELVRGELEAYREEFRAYMQEKRGDRPKAATREGAKEPRAKGDRPAAGAAAGEGGGAEPRPAKKRPAQAPPEEGGARERAQALVQFMDGVPDPAPAQRRVWALLTGPQREAVEAALVQERAKLEARRGDVQERVMREEGVTDALRERVENMSAEEKADRIERAKQKKRLEQKGEPSPERATPKGGSPD